MRTPSDSPRRLRWWIPSVILLLSIPLITWLQFADTNFRPHKSVLLTIVTLLLLALWYIFFTGLALRHRLALLGVLLVVVIGSGFVIKNFTRIEGAYTGSGFPRLVWKWSPKADAKLSGLAAIHPNVISTAEPNESLPDFPEFLGPGRTNVVQGIRLATDWKSHPPKELWRQPVGLGWSGFAIVGGRAITQEQRGENELVVCYDLLSGQPVWAHTNKVRFSEMLGGAGPRATPTIVSNRVFALGATGILDCFDLSEGKPVWSRDTLKENQLENITWGKSSSPLVFDNLVVVSGGEAGPLLLAFQKDSGAAVWRGGNGRSSYASPVLASLAGRRQILSVNARNVTGHDPIDGAVLWEYSWPGDFPKCSQPVAVAPDKVFISAGYGLGAALLQLQPAADGKFTASEAWKNRGMKTQFANVAIRDGFVYGMDDGILSCIELETGKRQWKDGRYGHGQSLLVEDLLLVQTEPGAIVLVEANPNEHREVARWPALKSKTWNNPVLSGSYLLVRNDQEMACLQLPLRP